MILPTAESCVKASGFSAQARSRMVPGQSSVIPAKDAMEAAKKRNRPTAMNPARERGWGDMVAGKPELQRLAATNINREAKESPLVGADRQRWSGRREAISVFVEFS